jgi:capsular exopolysaccharide synthesis family protein
MLDKITDGRRSEVFNEVGRGDETALTYSEIAFFCRMRWLSISVMTILGIGAAALYLAAADPVYTARAQLLIERTAPRVPDQQMNDLIVPLDTAQVESHIAVLRSESIAVRVIDELDLLDDPEFGPGAPSYHSRLTDFVSWFSQLVRFADGKVLGAVAFSGVPDNTANVGMAELGEHEDASATPQFERTRHAADNFASRLTVRRIGLSHGIEVSFESTDPDKAAAIANAIARAYIQERVEAKTSSNLQGSRWMEDRIEELRSEMNAATRSVQDFRAAHDYRITDRGDAGITGGDSKPTLEELEATADTYRRLYESFLQAYAASVHRHSYPVADGRIITPASRPLAKSFPRDKLVLAFGSLMGLIGGVGMALFRHTVDRNVHSGRQLRRHVGLECLGVLPALRFSWKRSRVLGVVVREPFSPYGDALRSVKTAIGLSVEPRPVRVLGITSARPLDGKTTLASNLAALFAISGTRTLVVDADVHTAGLSRLLAPGVSSGVIQAIDSPAKAAELLVNCDFGYDLLPSQGSRPVNSADLFGSDRMRELLKLLAADYDMIIVDMPPINVAGDACALSPLLDGVVIAAKWAETRLEEVGEVARSLHLARANILGGVITQAPSTGRLPYGGG